MPEIGLLIHPSAWKWNSGNLPQSHPALIAFTSRSYISMLVLLLRRAQQDREVSHVDAAMERENPKVNTDRGAASTPFYSPALPTVQGEVYEVSGKRAT
jgi:hypothetical protein